MSMSMKNRRAAERHHDRHVRGLGVVLGRTVRRLAVAETGRERNRALIDAQAFFGHAPYKDRREIVLAHLEAFVDGLEYAQRAAEVTR